MTPSDQSKDAPSQSDRPQQQANGGSKPDKTPVRYTDWASI